MGGVQYLYVDNIRLFVEYCRDRLLHIILNKHWLACDSIVARVILLNLLTCTLLLVQSITVSVIDKWIIEIIECHVWWIIRLAVKYSLTLFLNILNIQNWECYIWWDRGHYMYRIIYEAASPKNSLKSTINLFIWIDVPADFTIRLTVMHTV